jgi:hypothetical protein
LPVVVERASSWRRNSAISRVLLASSAGLTWLPAWPSAPRQLPVEVEAVEDPGRAARPARRVVHRQVALEVDVHAGGDELLARRVRGGHVGEVLGARPAAQRDQHLEVRVLDLELAELVVVAAQRLPAGVGHAVDGLGGGEGPAVVGFGVTVAVALVRVLQVGGGALRDPLQAGEVDRVDVAERVVEVGHLGGGTVGVQVLHEELPAVDPPLHQVPDPGVPAADDVGRGHLERSAERRPVVVQARTVAGCRRWGCWS